MWNFWAERVSRGRSLGSRKKEKETTERYQEPASRTQRKQENTTYRIKVR